MNVNLYKIDSSKVTTTVAFKNGEPEGETIEMNIDSWPANGYYDFLASHAQTEGFNIADDTMAFQQKYGLYDPNIIGFLPVENMKVKLGHLDEEMAEIKHAYETGDLYEFCDGILDLVYVGLGTLNLMNMPANELWKDIHIRNMCKIRATADNMGKRGSTFDVIKPEGWTKPRTKEIIDEHLARLKKKV